MAQGYKLTDRGREAIREICGALRDVVATRETGFPAGELYAICLPWCETLDRFELLMTGCIGLGLIEKRGQLYFAKEKMQ